MFLQRVICGSVLHDHSRSASEFAMLHCMCEYFCMFCITSLFKSSIHRLGRNHVNTGQVTRALVIPASKLGDFKLLISCPSQVLRLQLCVTVLGLYATEE